MIAHNEEQNILQSLESVKWANEIIVVDCESKDETVKIASQFSDKIYSRPNIVNLNVNKNFSFSQATGDWIFCLDADEIIPNELKDEILSEIGNQNEFDGYFLKRKNYFFENWLKYGGQYPDLQLRLFRRTCGKFPEKHVHERIEINGKTAILKSPFEHHPYKSVSIFISKMDFYTSFEAKKYFEQNVSTNFYSVFFYIFARPMKRFISRYVFKGGFLDGITGFYACFFDIITQIISFGKYYYFKKQT
ncbi:MAG: glycosyltransferase family 2 protein [Bacteroidota bacterium]